MRLVAHSLRILPEQPRNIHSAVNEYVQWRHTWRATYSSGNAAELHMVEYRTGPMRDYATANPAAFQWGNGTPWANAQFGFHSLTPLYDGQQPVDGVCTVLGGTCYPDSDDTTGTGLLRLWLAHNCDDIVIWDALRQYDDRPWPFKGMQ
jgi:hypothetical protein